MRRTANVAFQERIRFDDIINYLEVTSMNLEFYVKRTNKK